MKITAITAQVRNENRVNVSVDGVYLFSLDMYQLVDVGVKVGYEYSQEELAELQQESEFGKLYGRALEYTLMRPHSEKEVRDYLWRKTRATKYKSKMTGEVKERQGASQKNADRVLERLKEKGYVNDETFAKYWLENRSLVKGASRRKLQLELRQKGVETSIIEQSLQNSSRDDTEELAKIILKKQHLYDDQQKLMTYLVGQGFSYDMVKRALSDDQ